MPQDAGHATCLKMLVMQHASRCWSCIMPQDAGHATCLKMLVMQHASRCWFADVHWPAPLTLLRHFAAQYVSLVIIIINDQKALLVNLALPDIFENYLHSLFGLRWMF